MVSASGGEQARMWLASLVLVEYYPLPSYSLVPPLFSSLPSTSYRFIYYNDRTRFYACKLQTPCPIPRPHHPHCRQDPQGSFVLAQSWLSLTASPHLFVLYSISRWENSDLS